MREVQKNSSQLLPQKVPSRYRISLHIDDESIICTQGRTFGYEAYQLDGPDDEWKEKIIKFAGEVRHRKELREGIKDEEMVDGN